MEAEANGDWVSGEPEQPEPMAEGDKELVEARLRNAARIEPTCLDEEFIRLPGDIAFWTARHAAAIGHSLRAEGYRKKLRALLLIEHRETMIQHGFKPTESQVDSKTECDDRYQEAVAAEITCEVERERLKGAVNALMAKRDMLVQMGANHRAEMERDPVVRDRAGGSRYGR